MSPTGLVWSIYSVHIELPDDEDYDQLFHQPLFMPPVVLGAS